MIQWYRMLDREPNGMIAVDRREAQDWNDRGYGIFWTVNEFNGPRRIENLSRVRAWCVDLDAGSKDEQSEKLHRSPLVPSLIVETKAGYHAYWSAKDGAADTWNLIMLELLVPYFGADKNARDLARVLRVPGFKHMKNPQDPFRVKQVWRHAVTYSQVQVWEAFRDYWTPNEDENRRRHEAAKSKAERAGVVFPKGDDFWERVYNLDCEEGLRRLSGHWSVGGERYDFRSVRNGNLNLVVDGKQRSCFIDTNKRIGSMDKGGPTLAQWLRWFRHDWKTVVDVLKQTFPELEAA